MSEENNTQKPQGGQAPKEQGNAPTVKEGLDLLKRLADFNSKKEDFLKKVSDISRRMEKRADGVSPFSIEGLPEYMKQEALKRVNARMPDEFKKIAYTRTRETPKPTFTQGCFGFFMPNKKAITDEWIELARDGQSDSFSVTDEGIVLPPGCAMCIPTGIKFALPKDLALLLMCKKGLSLTFPTVFTEHFKDEELIVSIVNESVSEIPLLFETHLFMGYPIHLENNLGCEELLNSTYEDWVHGTING